MTPLSRYQALVNQCVLQPDLNQFKVMQVLDKLYQELICFSEKPELSFKERLVCLFKPADQVVMPKGIYLWGKVGRGKTYLSNLFYESLPFGDKHRVHYHRLMLELQREMHALKKSGHAPQALELVATRMATRMRLLFIDEVHIHNIGDAMTISGLLHGLKHHGVVCIMTSNVDPAELYIDGLQAESFESARQLILTESHVINMDSPDDYRLRALTPAEVFFVAETPEEKNAADLKLHSEFKMLTEGQTVQENGQLEVNNRFVEAQYVANDTIWFTFESLCKTFRSASDYIDLTKQFDTFFISDVPKMGEYRNDEARRFINLIDQIYATKVNLVMVSEADIEHLYGGNLLADEFKRTMSRLKEMQSEEYLALPHVDKE